MPIQYSSVGFTSYLTMVAAIVLFTGTSMAFAIPSGNVVQGQIAFDKTVYSTGENVKINLWGSGCLDSDCLHPFKSTYVRILNATTSLEGTNVLYQQTKDLVNNTVQFNYTTPSMNSTYRYLVQIYADQSYCCPLDSAYFVTRQGTQKIIISDVELLTSKVTPGQEINFTAKITDGLGNNISDFKVKGDLPQTDGGMDYLATYATYNNKTNLYNGVIPVPQSWSQYPQQNGTYHLRISATTPYVSSRETSPYVNQANPENKTLYVEDQSKTVWIDDELQCDKYPSNQFCLVKTAKIAQYHIYNTGMIKPGDEVDYEVQVVDMKGNPINLEVDARLFYPASWGQSVSNSWGVAYDQSKEMAEGRIGMPQDIPPGNYTIGFFLPGNDDMQKPDAQMPISVYGENQVPEFPLASVVLLVSIVSVIAFYRFKIWIN